MAEASNGISGSGRVAIVTGATRGIGRFAAEVLARSGLRVGLCARTEADVTDVAAALADDHGVAVYGGSCDVSDHESASSFVAQILEKFGRVDVLVNNAAAMKPVGPLHRVDPREWAHTLQVNVVGVVNMTAAVLPTMLEQGGGSIVNVSGGGTGGPGVPSRLSAYTTSKAAVVALTETLARELAPHRVRVNALAPGGTGAGLMDDVLAAGPDLAGPELIEATLRQRERPASLEDFGEMLLFLASDESSWLTGRLLSARWENPARLAALRERLIDSSLYTLRRIDDELYTEVKQTEPAQGGC